jgi:protein involved in polysaccharide export with SLBB domain
MRFAALLAAALFAAPIGAAAAVAPSYIIAPGDRLDVRVYNEETLSQKVLVTADGLIVLPMAGPVRVAGTTPGDASALIAKALSAYLRAPAVSVDVVGQGQITVQVIGNVKEPGTYKLRQGARMSEALAAAHGIATVNGDYPPARLAVPDGPVRQIALDPIMRKSDQAYDVVLADRATIYVNGPAEIEVSVLGAVGKPGVVRINEGDRLSMAIAKAGNAGSVRSGDYGRVLVTRTEPDGRTETHPVDLYQAIDKGDLRYDPFLKKGDVVFVPIAARGRGLAAAGFLLVQRLAGF